METASKRACTAAVNVTHMVEQSSAILTTAPRSPRAALVPRTWARTSRIRRRCCCKLAVLTKTADQTPTLRCTLTNS